MSDRITWRQSGARLIGTTTGPTFAVVACGYGYTLERDGVVVERTAERYMARNKAERLWAKERENVHT